MKARVACNDRGTGCKEDEPYAAICFAIPPGSERFPEAQLRAASLFIIIVA